MKAATDCVEVILQFVKAGIPLAKINGVQFFVLESEWKSLPHSSKISLSPFKTMGTIRFIDLDDLFFTEVFALCKKYGQGISLANYFIMKYCMNNGTTLITSDPAIFKIGTELRIAMRAPEAFQLDLSVERIIQRERVIQVFKQEQKIKGKMHSG